MWFENVVNGPALETSAFALGFSTHSSSSSLLSDSGLGDLVFVRLRRFLSKSSTDLDLVRSRSRRRRLSGSRRSSFSRRLRAFRSLLLLSSSEESVSDEGVTDLSRRLRFCRFLRGDLDLDRDLTLSQRMDSTRESNSIIPITNGTLG